MISKLSFALSCSVLVACSSGMGSSGPGGQAGAVGGGAGAGAGAGAGGGFGATGGGGLGAGGAGGAAGGSGAGATGAKTLLSCVGLIDCLGQCAEGDTSCEDQCLSQGSPEGDAELQAIVDCINANGCADDACLLDMCKSELSACMGATVGEPIQNPPATGSVPAEFVGDWMDSEYYYTFDASGAVHRVTSSKLGTCTSTVDELGTASADSSTLTLYFTSGSTVLCNKSSDEPYTAVQEQYAYTIKQSEDGFALVLQKPSCSDFCGVATLYKK